MTCAVEEAYLRADIACGVARGHAGGDALLCQRRDPHWTPELLPT